MDEQKLTVNCWNWFPPEVLPEREGVYELDDADDDGRCFARFDGEHWYYGVWEFSFGKRQDVLRRALLQPVRRPGSRSYRWRGLAEPPLTDWFDPDTPPEREGVYETDESDKGGQCFAYWDGEKFGFRCWSHLVKGGAKAAIKRAHENADLETVFPNLTRWRGLAVQP